MSSEAETDNEDNEKPNQSNDNECNPWWRVPAKNKNAECVQRDDLKVNCIIGKKERFVQIYQSSVRCTIRVSVYYLAREI
jgi:hypothetical protein